MVLLSVSFLFWYGKLLTLASENGKTVFSVVYSHHIFLVDFVVHLILELKEKKYIYDIVCCPRNVVVSLQLLLSPVNFVKTLNTN